MEKLISTNEYNYQVDTQLNKDRIQWDNPNNFIRATVTSLSMAAILRENETKGYLINFLHGALLSPVKPILVLTIKNGHHTTWTNLDSKLVAKYLHPTLPTVQYHLN